MKKRNVIPKTYGEAIAQGYKDGDMKWQRGYVSRKQNTDMAKIHVAGGTRKGRLYVLIPAWRSSQYCVRLYLVPPKG